MKPEQLYKNLKQCAEKMDITISEQNFRNAGIQVKSGLCKVKGKNMFIMDKHLSIHRKNEILLDCLKKLDHGNIMDGLGLKNCRVGGA